MHYIITLSQHEGMAVTNFEDAKCSSLLEVANTFAMMIARYHKKDTDGILRLRDENNLLKEILAKHKIPEDDIPF